MAFSDEQLAVKSKHGDKEAFEELIRRYQKPIYNICYRYLGNPHDSMDAVQETFIRLYKKFTLFNEDYSFKPWLYRIAINIAKDYLKKQRPWEELDLSLKSERGDPETNLELTQTQEDIKKALLMLPEKYRMAIILRHIRQLEYQEIAEILDLPLNTVKTHVKRGREMLRMELKEVEL